MIEASQVFQFIQKLPKGAGLHLVKICIKKRATLKQSFYFSFCPPSAVRPSVLPKKFSWLCPSVRPGANTVGSILYSGANPIQCLLSGEVFYGRSVCRSEGSRTSEGIVVRQTADGWKFWLLFRTALKRTKTQKKLIKRLTSLTTEKSKQKLTLLRFTEIK